MHQKAIDVPAQSTPARVPRPAGASIPESGRGDVSVVVCTFDIKRREQLFACLQSLQRQTLRPREVLVVVDGSAAVAEALRQRGGPERVHVLDRNSGPSVARNAGVALIRSRWVAFLDDDAVADESWLQHLVESAEQSDAAGASGWSKPIFAGPEPRWFPPELLWTVGCSHRGLARERSMTRNIFGGCAVLRTDLFRRVGGYDVNLGRQGSGVQGGEEADLCLRISGLDSGPRFVHVPEAVIHHRVPQARLRQTYLYRRCFSDGRTKSQMARRLGGSTLNVERDYLMRTVPSGIVGSLARGRWDSAFVLSMGIASAGCGYLAGRLRSDR